MKLSHLISLSCFFFYLVVVGASDELETWKLALPNTQMPKSLFNILPSGKTTYLSTAEDALKSLSEETTTQFFTEKDLFSDQKVQFSYPKTTSHAKLLPDETAKTIPFRTAKLPLILEHFSVNPNSPPARAMKETLEECEEENKLCVASLKALVDYAAPKLGGKAKIYATDEVSAQKQAYTVEKGGVRDVGDKSIVCHKEKYVYGLFLCHEVRAKAYEVSLVGADGTRAKALAVCHGDKESLKGQKFEFAARKVEPGSTTPLCHFLPSDDLVWMPN